MPELVFESTADWKSETECDLIIKGKRIVTVSPPPEFGGKEGFCVPEEVFAAFLASCMNTLFASIAKNSKLGLKNLKTKVAIKMDAEGLSRLIFTSVHFDLNVRLENDDERSRKKAERVYQMAQKICPLRQSWGEGVPLTFVLNFQ
jgi:organic hydroperoxide reductase OsmC/OhrA